MGKLLFPLLSACRPPEPAAPPPALDADAAAAIAARLGEDGWLVPIARHRLAGMGRLEGRTVLFDTFSSESPIRTNAGRITVLPDDPGEAPFHWYTSDEATLLATSPGEPVLAVGSRTAIALYDARVGGPISLMFVDREPTRIVLAGRGDDRMVLYSGPDNVTRLLDAQGNELGTYPIEGTTPTITRVYTGYGSHHRNLLDDAPSWPVALALSEDGRYVAVGGSDSAVRLWDRETGEQRTLSFDWPYEERRHMGGNPDLNGPLAMRFSPDGGRLVVLHHHGEILTWSLPEGRLAHALPGACSDEEVAGLRRFQRAHEEPIDDEDRDECGHATTGAIRADLGAAVSAVFGGLRLRELPSGAARDLRVEGISDDWLALVEDGSVLHGDTYGDLDVWKEGEDRSDRQWTSPRQAVRTLTADGRFLVVEGTAGTTAWEVASRSRLDDAPSLAPCAHVFSLDGSRRLSWRGDALEVSTGDGEAPIRVAAPDALELTCTLSDSGALLAVAELNDERPLRLVHLPEGQTIEVEQGRVLALAADGSAAAIASSDGTLRLHRTADGALLHAFPPDERPRQIALSPDGAFAVWLENVSPEVSWDGDEDHPPVQHGKPANRVWRLLLDGRSRPRPIHQEPGWGEAISMSPDGSRLLLLTEDGAVLRYRLRDDTVVRSQGIEHIQSRRGWWMGDHVLAFDRFDTLTLHRDDDELTLLATIHPLDDGGWLVLGAAGAVEGTAGAVAHTLTVTGTGAARAFADGDAAWTARQTEGVLRRALGGEIAAPDGRAP